MDEKPSIQPMENDFDPAWKAAAQKHIDELCREYNITTQVAASGFASAEFGTEVGTLISIPHLESEMDYLVTLHEIAHSVFEHHTSLFEDPSKVWMYSDPKVDKWGHVVMKDNQEMIDLEGEEEAWCWAWAFDNLQVAPTREMYQECHEGLMTYHTSRVEKTGPAFDRFNEIGRNLNRDRTIER